MTNKQSCICNTFYFHFKCIQDQIKGLPEVLVFHKKNNQNTANCILERK